MSHKPTNVKEREQRRRLCEQQKWRCHWCQRQMRWVVLDGRGTLPLDAATLDHLDDRWSADRGTLRGVVRRVAACRECNERRSNERTKTIYAEHQRQRSTEGHQR